MGSSDGRVGSTKLVGFGWALSSEISMSSLRGRVVAGGPGPGYQDMEPREALHAP